MENGQISSYYGIQNILIPMSTFNMTQGNNVGTHLGANAVDLSGNDAGKDFAYFPFDAICKSIDRINGNAVWWESQNPVRFADGTVDYCTMMIIHDDSLDGIYLGARYKQGQQMAQEGSSGYATGNHLHIEFSKGKFYKQYDKNQYGTFHLPNSISIDNVCYADNTVFKNGQDFKWKYTSDLHNQNSNSDNNKKQLFLPPEATSWYVYPLNVRPIIGNQCGILNPSLFGGLTYDIINFPQQDVATIQTRDYGIVNIYIGKETKAEIH